MTSTIQERVCPAAVRIRKAGLTAGLVFMASVIGGAQTPPPPPAPQQYQETVEVIAPTPVYGLGIDRDKIPSNVHTATADALESTGGVGVAEQLNLEAPSVYVNDATTNPFQPDLQFRGFVGSPLLGLPQGLAVYQDGVRLNEPFGDTVNWDLLPTSAIASISLMPGSNPLFGLNALGGAVSMQTKTGFTHPGYSASITGGSFGRWLFDGSAGAHSDRMSYFVAGSVLDEDGWRDFSPSKVRQLFGSMEWRGDSTVLDASLTAGKNRLIGNGSAPIELLEEDRAAIFTYPDETKTGMALLNLRAKHTLSPTISLDGMFYYRHASIDTFNGDDSDYDECEDDDFDEFLCADEGDGDPVIDQFDQLIPVDEDDELNGTNNTSSTRSNGWGGTFQATIVNELSGRPNHFIAGVTFDGGGSDYGSDTEIARLTDARGTIGTGLFDQEAVVRVDTSVRHAGLFVGDFFTLASSTTVMGAARLNHSTVSLRDQIGTELDGDHSFTRLNPAVGVTHALSPTVTLFGSFSMSSRVPAPSELSCADPEDPCRLPNAFVADPPLEQVVASTFEGGARGRQNGISWNGSAFRTDNSNDIMFVSSGALTNTGHFENVGDTVRQGFELGASSSVGAIRWGAAYTFLMAQFRTPFSLSSPNHPDEVDGEIEVESGDTIPGIPRHNLKGQISASIKRLMVGANVLITSGQYLRGDEANLLPSVDGYGLVNLNAQYELHPHLRIKARIANLLGVEYETFGLLGEADEVLGDDYEDPRFLSPGAPRAAWVGLELTFR